MASTDADRLDEMQDHIVALQWLLMSHITATEAFLPSALEATIDIAETQVESAIASGRMRVATRLRAMFDALRYANDLPPVE